MTASESAQFNLGPAILPDFATGAYFHCLLAWPTLQEMVEFHRVSAELVAETIRLTMRSEPQVLDEQIARWPQFDWVTPLRLAEMKQRKSVGTLKNRLTKRMEAGRMGIGRWCEEIPDIEVRLPEGLRRVSLDQLSKLVQPNTHIDDPENVEKLVWRTSRPIIHIAMAAQVELSIRGANETAGGIDTQDLDFFRSTVKRGNAYVPMIMRDPLFASGSVALTEVNWIE